MDKIWLQMGGRSCGEHCIENVVISGLHCIEMTLILSCRYNSRLDFSEDVFAENIFDLNQFESLLNEDPKTTPSPTEQQQQQQQQPPQQPQPQQQIERDPVTKQYHCKHCPKSFPYISRLLRHLTAHQRKQFRCRQCEKYFSRADVLANHVDKVHNKNNNNNNISVIGDGKFQCPECPAILSSNHHLQRQKRWAQSEGCGKAPTIAFLAFCGV